MSVEEQTSKVAGKMVGGRMGCGGGIKDKLKQVISKALENHEF